MKYRITALMSHLGGDGSGHYRTALRLEPGVTQAARPYQWLLTDDWSKAQPVWHLPTWFTENTTMAWLVRDDRVHLHDLTMQSYQKPLPQTDPVAAMLALMPKQTSETTDEPFP